VLSHLIKRSAMPASLYEAVIANPSTPGESIADFARTTQAGAVLEFIALNQQLLIQNPPLIEALLSNPHRTSEAERRVIETRREFCEKERGAAQIASELRAQGKDAAAEFIENSEFASSLVDSDLTADP